MKTLAEDIRNRQLKHVYLLYGAETYLIRQYRDRLKAVLADPEDTMNFSSFSGKDIDAKQLIDLAETMPFFADHRSIFIEQSGYFKKAPEELAEYLGDIPETVYFVFCETEVDRRNRLFKQVKKYGRAVEFQRQKEDVLMRWILGKLQRENKKITRPVMELFLSKTGNDMELIDRELEKLICYTLDRDVIRAKDVEAVCVHPVSDKIFEMVDAIAGKQQRKALELYHDLLRRKEPPIRILALMTRQFQTLMQLKELTDRGFDYKYMAGKVGVPEFAVRKYIGQSRKFSARQIQAAVRDGVQAEEDIKTGRIADRLAAELFLVKYSTA
ncbi:MAG: DNA polymerase III subunit delta [Clostridiales bacterium]|nr:DNA polymerase III subunit delta [Clostridiales bacterium]